MSLCWTLLDGVFTLPNPWPMHVPRLIQRPKPINKVGFESNGIGTCIGHSLWHSAGKTLLHIILELIFIRIGLGICIV